MSLSDRLLSFLLPVIILVALGGGGVAVMNALKKEPEKADEQPKGIAIFAEPIRLQTLQLDLKSQGEVQPLREVSVSSQIAGPISYVSPRFLEGAFVRRGEVLVRIEDADYKLGVVRAQSMVASAQQRLIREQAESELARQDLEELGITAPSALALREPQLLEARASLDSAKASLADAELALQRTIVRAPFDGRVRTRDADVGQFVSPGQSLGQIFGTDVAQVSLPLTDIELGQLGLPLAFSETANQRGPDVILTAAVGGKQRTWTGRIRRTAAAVDSRTRLVAAIAEVDDPFGEGADGDAPLAPGLFVKASIKGQVYENVLVAPREALRGKDQLYIAHPEEETLEIRTVEVLTLRDDGAYLLSGAEPGELGVISPIQGFDGMSVTVASQASPNEQRLSERQSSTTQANRTTTATEEGVQ